ncbi:MAG: CoxG family protein [Vicinamibacterales bacterium]
MEITGTYTFNAPPDHVWTLLMDPQVISSCIPGCEGFEPLGDDRYKAKLKVALAAITGSYEGTIVLSEKVPTASYRLTADGQGRPGSVKGSAAVSLRPNGNDTVVDVQGTVQAAGPVARLGQRLISSVSKMMMDRFFACLQGKVTSS